MIPTTLIVVLILLGIFLTQLICLSIIIPIITQKEFSKLLEEYKKNIHAIDEIIDSVSPKEKEPESGNGSSPGFFFI